MQDVSVKGAPLLGGWVIAAGVAVVATAVAMVMFGFNVPQATFVAAILFLAVGLILGMPWTSDAAGPAAALAPVAEAPAAPAQGTMTPSRMLAEMPPEQPVPAAAVVPDAPEVGVVAVPQKPAGLAGARGGVPDDLKVIIGIGPKLEQLCHRLGFYHFDQIAAWTDAEIAWVDDNLEGFRGRVTRDNWVGQARALAAGGRAL